jgi:C_GCAxxG_C_C family probable redox protein
MTTTNDTNVTRRSFVGCCAGLAVTAQLRGADDSAPKKLPQKSLFDPLTSEEEKAAALSVMAKEILNAKGCSCAESVLLAALRYLKQPEELLHAAAAFGGGMGQRDLCGLLTGGFMALGNAAGAHHKDRSKMKAHASKMTKEYWKWWQAWAPLHCRELKPQYGKLGYVNMKKRVAAKIEELIQADAKSVEEA